MLPGGNFVRATIAAVLLFGISAPVLGQTSPDCRTIEDSLERLRCWDGQASPLFRAPPPPTEDTIIAKAKARVKRQLGDPDGAWFSDVKMKTIDGKTAVCGTVNAKNA